MTTLYPGFSILPNSNYPSEYGSKLYNSLKCVYNIASQELIKLTSESDLITMS